MTAPAVRRARPAVIRPTGQRPHLRVEKELLRSGVLRLAAVDEVGRGALAGPVTIGIAVVTTRIGRVPEGLRDSKLLTPAARERLAPAVRRWAVDWAVGHAWPAEIDLFGIMAGMRLAARRALAQLTEPVDAILLDGNHNYLAEPEPALFDEPRPVPDFTGLPEVPALVRTRIKADLTCAGVAGASVLAKTTRDALLVELAAMHPEYGFEVHKGYATPEHCDTLRRIGPCPEHRRSWRLPGSVLPDRSDLPDGMVLPGEPGLPGGSEWTGNAMRQEEDRA